MEVFYCEHDLGCSIKVAPNEEKARRAVRRALGLAAGHIMIRKATNADLDWVRRMGGWTPQPTNSGGK